MHLCLIVHPGGHHRSTQFQHSTSKLCMMSFNSWIQMEEEPWFNSLLGGACNGHVTGFGPFVSHTFLSHFYLLWERTWMNLWHPFFVAFGYERDNQVYKPPLTCSLLYSTMIVDILSTITTTFWALRTTKMCWYSKAFHTEDSVIDTSQMLSSATWFIHHNSED